MTIHKNPAADSRNGHKVTTPENVFTVYHPQGMFIKLPLHKGENWVFRVEAESRKGHRMNGE